MSKHSPWTSRTGAHAIRLDAVAYLWKQAGTPCVHLPETHEVVRIFRDILELVAPEAILLTETNVPHAQNISYFGNGDETHMVYQFSLPPLMFHTLLSGDSSTFNAWADALDGLPPGCTYLNFTASHDGIGVRPLEGLADTEALQRLARHTVERGGQVSTKRNADGSESPYELNITYFDALGEAGGADPSPAHVARFLCSQTIPLALRGVPAVYFNSLFGARNNAAGLAETGRARTLNRQKWTREALDGMLTPQGGYTGKLFKEYTRILRIRRRVRAFHPEAPQAVLDVGPKWIAIRRTSLDGEQDMLSLSNVTGKGQRINIRERFAFLANATVLRDHLARQDVGRTGGLVELRPYQTRWITASARSADAGRP